jgi:DNA-binding transcriptional LysR family regulator
MDIELARTFIDIVRSGSLVATAERLHLTQTAVTARVKNLEAQLGCQLFIRNRAGASLTAEGLRFVDYATQLIQVWDKAKFDLSLPEENTDSVTIGGEIALWNPLLLNWVSYLQNFHGDMAITVETGEAASLINRVNNGVVDIAVVYRPEYMPGLKIELLLEEKLIMVRTPASAMPYVYIDWGPTFRKQHDAALPGKARTSLSMDFGLLALQYLLRHQGSGYFRARVVESYIEEGRLERVTHAPEFTYPIYVICRDNDNSDTTQTALRSLREAAVHGIVWS